MSMLPEVLCDGAGGDITHDKQIKKFKRSRRKGTSTAEEAERFHGVKGKHCVEDAKQLGMGAG
jgi:hypothetical protein